MASKQMSYCSLEEAWGENYANLYKKDDSMLVKMPRTDKYSDDTILKDRNITKISKPVDKISLSEKEIEHFYMDNKNQLENQSSELISTNNNTNKSEECQKLLDHFLHCDDCRNELQRILNMQSNSGTDNNKSNSLIEKFNLKQNLNDNYIDVFILILTGIFIIFVLDCFVRLGRNFRK